MSAAVILDAGPLGLLCHPKPRPGPVACRKWLTGLLTAGCRVLVPEITDYEIRRELLRTRRGGSLARLDRLATQLEYLPLTTNAMRLAAELWAHARQQGQPTATDAALDADVILAAQALALGEPNIIVATTNVGHLGRFVPAELWHHIIP